MSKSGLSHRNLLHPGRENVHPLFDPTKFAPDIDYEAFYKPAVLATQLISSPQSLQHDYCFYFGKTVPAATPSGFSYTDGPNLLPYQYACDKTIGELTRADIKDVEKQRFLLADRITFKVKASGDTIPRWVYNEALTKNTTPERNARWNLQIAAIFIHELAHAAHFRMFGPTVVQEDFREDSHVAEAGYEAVARIFGFTPFIGHGWSAWITWQYRQMSKTDDYHDLAKIGRKEWQLPSKPRDFAMAPEFAMKLSNEDFWTGAYVELGVFALFPDEVHLACRPEFRNHPVYKALPLSIRDLFRTGGPNYAKKKYVRYSNPERQLRQRPEYDYRFREFASMEKRLVSGD